MLFVELLARDGKFHAIPAGQGFPSPLRPGDPPGSLSDNHPSGHRQIITFRAQDAETSIVGGAHAGVDWNVGIYRGRTDIAPESIIKRLTAADPELVINVTPDSRPTITVRFRHVSG